MSLIRNPLLARLNSVCLPLSRTLRVFTILYIITDMFLLAISRFWSCKQQKQIRAPKVFQTSAAAGSAHPMRRALHSQHALLALFAFFALVSIPCASSQAVYLRVSETASGSDWNGNCGDASCTLSAPCPIFQFANITATPNANGGCELMLLRAASGDVFEFGGNWDLRTFSARTIFNFADFNVGSPFTFRSMVFSITSPIELISASDLNWKSKDSAFVHFAIYYDYNLYLWGANDVAVTQNNDGGYPVNVRFALTSYQTMPMMRIKLRRIEWDDRTPSEDAIFLLGGLATKDEVIIEEKAHVQANVSLYYASRRSGSSVLVLPGINAPPRESGEASYHFDVLSIFYRTQYAD